MTWTEVEELRMDIDDFNLDLKLWESFSMLERRDAVDLLDPLRNANANEFNVEELIG